MSIMAMKRFVEKFGTAVIVILALPILATLVYSGLGRNMGGNDASAEARHSTEQPIARVGDRDVSRAELDRTIEQEFRSQGAMAGMTPPPPAPEMMDTYRLAMLEQVKSQEAIVAAAKKVGVTIGDAELAAGRDRLWNEKLRATIAGQLGLSPTATDREIESTIQKQANPDATIESVKATVIDPARLKVQVALDSLKDHFRPEVKLDEAQVKRAYDEIQVRHILIKSGDGGLPEAQAKSKAEKVLAEVLKDPAKMPALAKQNSDDPGSKDKGGFYDWAPANQYVPEFTAGALAVPVGKVNPGLIKTSFGFHIIKLEGERPGKNAPTDWDKEKQKYLNQAMDRQLDVRAGEAIKAATGSVSVELLDPGLKAARAQREATGKDRDAKLNEALLELGKIPAGDDPLGTIALRKASIYEILGKQTEAIAAYEEALKARNLPEVRFKLANAYVKAGQKDKVKAQLDEIEKLPLSDPGQWKDLGDLYGRLGDKTNQRRALEKNQELTRRLQELQKKQMEEFLKQNPSIAPPKPKK